MIAPVSHSLGWRESVGTVARTRQRLVLARASTSLCLVRATVPTLSLQPKLWLTGAIMSAPIVLAEVPRAESVEEIELTRRATTCGQQRCTAATAIARVQAQPSAPPRTHRPRPHNTVCV